MKEYHKSCSNFFHYNSIHTFQSIKMLTWSLGILTETVTKAPSMEECYNSFSSKEVNQRFFVSFYVSIHGFVNGWLSVFAIGAITLAHSFQQLLLMLMVGCFHFLSALENN